MREGSAVDSASGSLSNPREMREEGGVERGGALLPIGQGRDRLLKPPPMDSIPARH